MIGQSYAAPGIDNVRIPHPSDLEPLRQITRGGHCGVAEEDRLDPGTVSHIERRQTDLPAVHARRRITNTDIAVGSHQSPGDAATFEKLKRLISRKSLGNASQIQPHALRLQRGRSVLRVKNKVPVTHPKAVFLKKIRLRKLVPASGPSPEIHTRPNRHIKRSIGTHRQFLTAAQHLPQLLAYRHIPTGARRTRQTAQFAVRIVVAQDAVEL